MLAVITTKVYLFTLIVVAIRFISSAQEHKPYLNISTSILISSSPFILGITGAFLGIKEISYPWVFGWVIFAMVAAWVGLTNLFRHPVYK